MIVIDRKALRLFRWCPAPSTCLPLSKPDSFRLPRGETVPPPPQATGLVVATVGLPQLLKMSLTVKTHTLTPFVTVLSVVAA
jgi:hypothetical protein